jgi:DNA-binding MarR family transcriptional regulator
MSDTITLTLQSVHHVRDRCLCLATQRAARVLARRFDRVFQPLGITNQQFSLMMPLSVPQPMPMGRLADFLAMDRTTLTAALKSLEKRGFVASQPDGKDRRIRRLALTEAGRAVLAAALPLWKEEHAKLDSELPEDGAPLRASLAGLFQR